MQVIIGSCTFDDIAGRVATTVVSHKPEANTICTDAGFCAMSSDGGAPMVPLPLGVAPVQGHPEIK